MFPALPAFRLASRARVSYGLGTMSEAKTEVREFDAVVVGAGFAGLYMLHRLRGMGLSTRVIERGTGVGGTWYWNRYPGARCDVESMEYSYQFSEELQQEWEWSERYATQPEILRYVNHVADRFDLRRDIDFNTAVTSAIFDEGADRWTVETSEGGTLSARFFVLATGCLSQPNETSFPGLENFAGKILRTQSWPHEEVRFEGQRVGVIGTGSSSIQSTPIIAEQAEHLYIFQRTANYSVPAHNQPLAPELVAEIKGDYANFRAANKLTMSGFGARHPANMEQSALAADEAERKRVFDARWAHGGLDFMGAFGDLLFAPEANDIAAEYVRDKIRDTVKDPATAERLLPSYALGCKRMCVDTGYYAMFNRENVTLVDVSEEPVSGFRENAICVGNDKYEVDTLVLATGFDAMTGAILKIDIRGRAGQSVAAKWEHGPKTYLGLQMHGFPNLFMITGPGSPSVLTNMLPSIEQHVDFIADAITHLEKAGSARIEPDAGAEEAWVAHVNELAGMTVLGGCNSWYLGANIPGKPRVFMPYLGFPNYVEHCEKVVAEGYAGFELS